MQKFPNNEENYFEKCLFKPTLFHNKLENVCTGDEKTRKRKFFEDERREKWGNSIMAFCLLIFPFSRYILFSKRKMWLPENSVFPFIQWNNFFSSLWKINEILLIFQTYFEIHLNFPWDFPFWNGFSQSPKLY